MKEKKLFCPYLNSQVTISSCTYATEPYGKGSKSVGVNTMCKAQECCSKRYVCVYSNESTCSFDPFKDTLKE